MKVVSRKFKTLYRKYQLN